MAINTTKDFDEMEALSRKLKTIKQGKTDSDDKKGRLKTDIIEIKAMPGYASKVDKSDREEIDSILSDLEK